VFLLFSTIIWFMVQMSKEYTQIIKVPVSYVNVPLDKSLSEDRPKSLDLRLQDRGFNIWYYKMFTPKLELNMGRAEEQGQSLVYYLEENSEAVSKSLGLDLDKSRFLVPEVVVGFQPKTKKVLVVRPQVQINYAVGYAADKALVLVPDSVSVSGPEAMIDSLEFVNTIKKEFNNVSRNLTGEVALDTTGLGRLSFYRNSVGFYQEVAKYTEGQMKIPVKLINVPANTNVSIFPKEVIVKYQVNLNKYDMVEAQDFSLVCDFSKLEAAEDYLLAELVKKPEFVNNIRLSERKIQFVIKR
jgi:hypothetical protein